MESTSEIPKKKGTMEFFLRFKRMKFQESNIFFFFSSEFFCELLYLRKNART